MARATGGGDGTNKNHPLEDHLRLRMYKDQLVNLTLTRGMLLMLRIYVLCKICAFMYELFKVYLVVKSTPYSPREL